MSVRPDTPASTATDPDVRPFRVEVPQEDLDDLRRRILATRWPEQETVAGDPVGVPDVAQGLGDARRHSQGVQLAVMQELARYWASEYDFRRFEARLNALPQFVTEIDGLDVHFIHLRSPHEGALPLVITHGWPGSVVEMLNVVGALTDPPAYGGRVEDAFDVVIPSLPGYGFSGKPTTTGWSPRRTAKAWITLMKRLGYARFVAQGGDWGAIVTDLMGVEAPPELIGLHSNMPGTVPPAVSAALTSGGPAPAGLSDEEGRAWERLHFLYTKGIGYATEMALRPQTLYGLADSPVALAAWMLDHDARSYEDIARAFDGDPVGGLTRDEVLDNITLTWVTNTGISSGRLYWENDLGFFDVKGVTVPVAVSVFPRELYQAPRSWAEQAYPGLVYFHEVGEGNHFAAWQEPALFVSEVRDGFRSLRPDGAP